MLCKHLSGCATDPALILDVSKSLGAFDPGLFDGLDGALINMLLCRLVVQLVPRKLMLVIGGYFIPHLALLLIFLRFWLCNVNIMLILLVLIVAYYPLDKNPGILAHQSL